MHFFELREIIKYLNLIVLYAGIFLHVYQSMRLKNYAKNFMCERK